MRPPYFRCPTSRITEPTSRPQYHPLVSSPHTPNTSVSVGEHFTAFIDAQRAVGRDSSTSDIVRAALRQLEEQELLRAAPSNVTRPLDAKDSHII